MDAAQELSKDYDIDAVIGDHPLYLQGVVPHLTKNQGIPSYVFGSGYIDKKVFFTKLESKMTATFHVEKELNDFLDQPLQTDERNEIDKYMNKRTQREDQVNRFDSSNTPSNIDTEGEWNTVVGVFPNMVWDGAYSNDNALFSNPFLWIEKTIELIPEDTLAIIKAHPPEKIRGTNESVVSYVLKNYPELPENIRIIEDGTNISAYSLLEDVEAAIVYSSTVGLEAAYYGIPAIVCSDAHYRDRDFTFDPRNESEYSNYLETIGSLEVTDQMREKAKKFAHTFFIRKHVDFPFYSTGELHSFRLVPCDQETIENASGLNTIVNSIMNGEVVMSPSNNQ
jgi:hypothetical protein